MSRVDVRSLQPDSAPSCRPRALSQVKFTSAPLYVISISHHRYLVPPTLGILALLDSPLGSFYAFHGATLSNPPLEESGKRGWTQDDSNVTNSYPSGNTSTPIIQCRGADRNAEGKNINGENFKVRCIGQPSIHAATPKALNK